MARGYPGAFGRKVNSPWVWIPLTILFIAPFFDWRRPFRMLHLDLLVLAAFGVSVAFFNDAQIGISVPIAYPLLVYLLGRVLWIGLRRDRPRPGLRLLVPVPWSSRSRSSSWSASGSGSTSRARTSSTSATPGVIGADRIADGTRLYGNFPKDNEHGDTYGPVNYVAYVPFEQIWPWSGRLGRPARRARRGGRVRPRSACCCCSSSAGACAGRTSACARLRVGGVPVHALRDELQRQRRPRRRARPVRPALGVRAAAPRGVRRARGDGEVRPAGARAALHHADAPARALRRRHGHRARALVRLRARVRRPADVLRPHARLPGLTRVAVHRSGACAGGRRRRRSCRSRACSWRWRSRSCRGGATSSGWPRCRPPC